MLRSVGAALRFAILGYAHESNSFALRPTGLAAFEERGVLRSEEIVAEHGGASTIVAGYLEATARHRLEAVPLVFAEAQPSGPISAEAYKTLTHELLEVLSARGPWDGVLLALHGAAVVDGLSDADGSFAADVRRAVGPSVPIGATLDLHANVSPRLVASTTVTVVYRTNPHLDARERASDCADIVVAAARGDVRPVQAIMPVPAVVNILRMGTDHEPMRSLMMRVGESLEKPGALSASLVQGFPYADVPHMGMACLAVHDGSERKASEIACALATEVWRARGDFIGTAPTPGEAVARAAGGRAVVLLDVGDNVGAGSTGDSVVLLAEAMRRETGAVAQTIHDPEAVRACVAAGAGARVELRVGGGIDSRFWQPVGVAGEVVSISDGLWEDYGPVHGGATRFDAGTTAFLRTGRGDALLLTSRVAPSFSARQYASLGIDLRDYCIIVAKGVHGPRASLSAVASEFIPVDTCGPTTAVIERLPYQNRGRVWPLDDIGEWSPSAAPPASPVGRSAGKGRGGSRS